MHTTADVGGEHSVLHDNANTIIEQQLGVHIEALEKRFDSDVLAFVGDIVYGADDAIRDAVEQLKNGSESDRLAVVLETPGGYIEVTQRIADIFRYHYGHVAFVVPNYAMSAGTVLVMSGDEIHMDYYSMLGPIDPQVRRPGGQAMIPALGYLKQYERLIDSSRKGELTTAELAFLVQNFDPAELYQFEQARELTISLLKEWLARFKFKDWVKTETRGKRVTKRMREDRASEIAAELNNTDRWHSHARGITIEVLRQDLGLRINDFGTDQELRLQIRAYHGLLKDFMMRLGLSSVLHSRRCFVPGAAEA